MARYGISVPKRKHNKVYTVSELYIEFKPILIKKLYNPQKSSRSIEDAEDIIQDSFEKLMKNWDNIRWDDVESLISIVVTNATKDHYRRFVRNQQCSDDTTVVEGIDGGLIEDPMNDILGKQFEETMDVAIDKLSKSERTAFILFYRDGMKAKDIAGKRHVGTVLTLLSRAREKILNHFDLHFEV